LSQNVTHPHTERVRKKAIRCVRERQMYFSHFINILLCAKHDRKTLKM
jgi:vesicle coat complex subunit